MIQAQAVLEFAVVVLDAPADLGQADQVDDGGVRGQIGQSVIGGRLSIGGPFDLSFPEMRGMVTEGQMVSHERNIVRGCPQEVLVGVA